MLYNNSSCIGYGSVVEVRPPLPLLQFNFPPFSASKIDAFPLLRQSFSPVNVEREFIGCSFIYRAAKSLMICRYWAIPLKRKNTPCTEILRVLTCTISQLNLGERLAVLWSCLSWSGRNCRGYDLKPKLFSCLIMINWYFFCVLY